MDGKPDDEDEDLMRMMISDDDADLWVLQIYI
jgi:hypothetical protein